MCRLQRAAIDSFIDVTPGFSPVEFIVTDLSFCSPFKNELTGDRFPKIVNQRKNFQDNAKTFSEPK